MVLVSSSSSPSFPASSKSPSILPCSVSDIPPNIRVDGGVGGNVEVGIAGFGM